MRYDESCIVLKWFNAMGSEDVWETIVLFHSLRCLDLTELSKEHNLTSSDKSHLKTS